MFVGLVVALEALGELVPYLSGGGFRIPHATAGSDICRINSIIIITVRLYSNYLVLVILLNLTVPQRQWFREWASILHYTYTTSLVLKVNLPVSPPWWLSHKKGQKT
jgi:hypothetical protein